MDKKKVKELSLDTLTKIKEAISSTDDALLGLKLANIASKIALIGVEVNKSDWVSVEDGLPPYDESVLVTNKETPEIVLKTSRTKVNGWNTDKNGFLCAIAFTITHWKPIEKLEE